MKNTIKVLTLTSVMTLSACGGGSTSSGPDIDIPQIPDLPPARVGAEFIADQCITNRVEIGGTRIVNSCDRDVNVRSVSGAAGAFGPNFLIRANSTQIVNGAQGVLAACFAPRVPGGVASITAYQCL